MIRQLKNFAHLLIALIANVVYGFPSKNIKVIGVTGTDGKTTTTHLIYHILTSAGKKASIVSSVFAHVAGQTYDTGFHVTTPDPFDVQKYIKRAVDHGEEYFILETTSHALDQNRVYGIQFEIGVVTNITHEHLDYHKTYDLYLQTKSKLLERSQTAVINRDDRSYEQLRKRLELKGVKLVTYGLKNKADYSQDYKKTHSSIADFNRYNYLAAHTVCSLLGLSDDIIEKSLKNFSLPIGRLEMIYSKEFKVMVDFAHTANAIEQLLSDLRPSVNGKLIHVFGSAAKRDRTKRPLMGEASGKYADVIIVTEEDYRDEDPKEIAAHIVEGIKKTKCKHYEVIVDRERAIEAAIKMVKKGDFVVVTGKGHEKSLARGTTEYPWSDQEAIRKALGVTA